jgi:hypothetical protein
MRIFIRVLRMVVMVAAVWGFMSVPAAACPNGYFQCGGAQTQTLNSIKRQDVW